MKQIFQTLLLSLFLTSLLLLPAIFPIQQALGETIEERTGLDKTADKAKILIKFTDAEESAFPLAVIIGRIIHSFLIMLGAIFLFFLILGGFEWMSAGGNEDKIKHAKGMIINAVHGIVIVMASYGLAGVIINALVKSASS